MVYIGKLKLKNVIKHQTAIHWDLLIEISQSRNLDLDGIRLLKQRQIDYKSYMKPMSSQPSETEDHFSGFLSGY